MTDGAPAAWLVESCRFTGFVPAGTMVETAGWFAEAAQAPVQSKVSQPGISQDVEQGPFESGKLTLAMNPARFDWTYTAADLPGLLTEIRNVGPLESAIEIFRAAISRWESRCPSLTRLAFGLVLVRPATTQAAGFRDLSRYLPFIGQLGLDGAEDFGYSINRPRQLELSGLVANRISRWSVVKFQSMQIQIELGGSRPQVTPVDIGWASRLEVDINTKPISEKLPVAPRDLFPELISLALEISERGDVK